MSTPDDRRELWRIGEVTCVLISCCSGAELQVLNGTAVMLRELYPMKSDLYERAKILQDEYAQQDHKGIRR
jgi:hypothetical protein